jgi:hypothetical protein
MDRSIDRVMTVVAWHISQLKISENTVMSGFNVFGHTLVETQTWEGTEKPDVTSASLGSNFSIHPRQSRTTKL